MTVPIFTIGIGASCAAAARFGEPVPIGVPAAELIVGSVVLMVLLGAARHTLSEPAQPVNIWPLAGLIAILGGIGFADRVDALNAQLLLVLALTVLWSRTDGTPDHAARPSEVDPSGLLGSLAGVLAAAMTGWAVLSGVDARIALGLVSANLLIWSIGARRPGVIAVAGIIATGIGVGCANVVRIVGGGMAQPEWGGGDRLEALGLEITSRPYLPGFGATLPDTMLLIIAALLVVLDGGSAGAGRRRWVTAGMLIGLCSVQITWMWIGAS